MKSVTLSINGERLEATIEPRTSLADLLRTMFGLTGTHLGCEHGICGACTVMINGNPSRSCITYAVQVDGADIRTIEGFDSDPVMERLRTAFTSHHALQCGFCTPGMLITARDIVTRLGDPGDRRVREELAGNLCRCTGYAGIVAAVRSVGEAQQSISNSEFGTPKLAQPEITVTQLDEENVAAEAKSRLEGAETLEQSFSIDAPVNVVWELFRNIKIIGSCIPGAELTEFDDKVFKARVTAKFGPIRASLNGDGSYSFDELTRSGYIRGSGKDRFSGSVIRGELSFKLREVAPATTNVDTEFAFKITGLLAQFSRGPLVREFVRVTMKTFSDNLSSRINPHRSGDTSANSSWFFRLLDYLFKRGSN